MDATRVQENFGGCALGDQRLTRRALNLGLALSEHFGPALAMSLPSAPALKRADEFSPMPRRFAAMIAPHCELTRRQVSEQAVVLRVGDTTDLDYREIVKKPTGVVVRAAHNRELEGDPHRLWETWAEQPIQAVHAVHLSPTQTRTARTALLAVRFCPVQLKAPPRLGHQTTFPV